MTVKADLEEKDVVSDGVEMVVLPGGMPGTLNLEKSPIVRAAVEAAAKDGVWVAAICAAPSVLGHLGLLKGRTATCYPGFEQELTGAQVTGAPVEVSENFITGRGSRRCDGLCPEAGYGSLRRRESAEGWRRYVCPRSLSRFPNNTRGRGINAYQEH